jgi:hypothetical protein
MPSEVGWSPFVLVLDYVCKDDDRLLDPHLMNPFQAFNVLMIANHLRMRELEHQVLVKVAIKQLNRENVILMLEFSHYKIH